jgi:hypothetical protein
MRSRVEVEVELATIRCADFATADGFRVAFALDGAFFTFSIFTVSSRQTCRISRLIQATGRFSDAGPQGLKSVISKDFGSADRFRLTSK